MTRCHFRVFSCVLLLAEDSDLHLCLSNPGVPRLIFDFTAAADAPQEGRVGFRRKACQHLSATLFILRWSDSKVFCVS